MKTLITLLTAVAIITACEHKNEAYCYKSQLTSHDPSDCICELLAKKKSANEKTKRSKIGLRIISPKINSLD